MTHQQKTELQTDPTTKGKARKPAQAIRFKRGLDLPISGIPEQKIKLGPPVSQIAIVGPDYVGMKPTMAVEIGDQVTTGQVLFTDKKQPGVCYTSPGCGKVVEIHRGHKRVFLSVVVKLEGSNSLTFDAYPDNRLDTIEQADVIRQLVDSGMWTALRERPFDRVPTPLALGPVLSANGASELSSSPQSDTLLHSGESDNASPCHQSTTCSGSCGLPLESDSCSETERSSTTGPEAHPAPTALFITAIDTRPLAADPEIIIQQRADLFYNGLRLLGRLGIEKNYLCTAPNTKIPGADLAHIEHVTFAGPHPAGLVGTHIHSLKPVGRNRRAWHINYQDVIAIGHLFQTGKIDTTRIVSLAGPGVERPRLIRTRLGANLDELVQGQLISDDGQPKNKVAATEKYRVISGSVLGGRAVAGKHLNGHQTAFLSRYDLQISVLPEFEKREFFGWISPGFKKFSVKNVVLSKLFGRRHRFAFDTAMHGGHRSIVPIGAYQKVMPLDLFPDFLLKALSMGDLELSETFGCLELTEEDVALLTYVCPGKADYGVMLRHILNELAKEV